MNRNMAWQTLTNDRILCLVLGALWLNDADLISMSGKKLLGHWRKPKDCLGISDV